MTMTDDIGSRLRPGMSQQEMEEATGRDVTIVTESEFLSRLIEPNIRKINDALKGWVSDERSGASDSRHGSAAIRLQMA